jgi:NAD(P)-dependent dehydrogenase (short-subunit alcohol dehydrogenase family)
LYDYIDMSARTVVITGGSKGIGLSITQAFLSEGFQVFVGSRNIGDIPSLKSKNVRFIQTDVRKERDVQNLIQEAIEYSGKLDTLINNAGYSEWRPIELIDESFLSDMLSTNLMGVFWGCKAALSVMDFGASIVNISSIAGKRGSANNSAYVATKFGVNGLTQAIAKEVGHRGIRVNSVCPVLIPTSGLLRALELPHSPAGEDAMSFINRFELEQSALKRLPTSSEVAEACLFLASSSASAITGQNINVDCGVFPQ